MRINKFLAMHTQLSRRGADTAVQNGRVTINGATAQAGDNVTDKSAVTLDGNLIRMQAPECVVILLNKPIGYVCSRHGQGAPTVYDLLPKEYSGLQIAGRLDKDSSGLVLLTNDGDLLHSLTHPSNTKQKIYHVTVNGTLGPEELNDLLQGVDIGDPRPSRFKSIKPIANTTYEIALEEGRNRQIRRSFEAIGYQVLSLSRQSMGVYTLANLKEKEYTLL
jgi:pseudouridine synthase